MQFKTQHTEVDFAPYYKGERALVTGGCGFIGSNLVIRLVDLGVAVTVVDAMLPGLGGNEFNLHAAKEKIKFVKCDLREKDTMARLLADQKYVFNIAGQVSHIESMTNPLQDLDINVRSHLAMLEILRTVNSDARVVFTSTRQVYGKPQYFPVDERHPVNPTDINGISKWSGEQLHTIYHGVFGIKTVSLRLTNTYGPRQLLRHNRQGFVPWFIRLAMEGREIQLYGGGSQLRDFNYVDDVVDALLGVGIAEKTWGKVYNLGGGGAHSLVDFVQLLIEVAGKGSYVTVPFPAEKKPIDIGDYYADHSRITEAVGWRPKVSLKEGIEKTIAYYANHMSHYVD